MIDAELMKDIQRQMLDVDVEMAKAALTMGITVMPSPHVSRSKPILMVHPEVYERLKEESQK